MKNYSKNNNETKKTCSCNVCSCAHKGGSGCSHGECKCRQNGSVGTAEKTGSTTK